MKLFKGWKLSFPNNRHLYFQLMSPLNKNGEGICYNFGLMKRNYNFSWFTKKNFYMYTKFSYDINSPSC